MEADEVEQQQLQVVRQDGVDQNGPKFRNTMIHLELVV